MIRRRLLAVAACLMLAFAGWGGVRALGVALIGQDERVVERPPATSCAEQLPLGCDAWSTRYGFGAAWIQVDPSVNQVVKVDQITGEVSLAVDHGRGVAIASDAVWVAVGGETLIRSIRSPARRCSRFPPKPAT